MFGTLMMVFFLFLFILCGDFIFTCILFFVLLLGATDLENAAVSGLVSSLTTRLMALSCCDCSTMLLSHRVKANAEQPQHEQRHQAVRKKNKLTH